MNSKDNATEKAEFVINALAYAHKHNLDINSQEDVSKILEALEPQPMNEEEVKTFMRLLQDADTLMEMTASKKTNQKTNLPN